VDPAGVAEDSEVDAMEEMVVVRGLGWGIGFHLLRGSCSFFRRVRTVSKSVEERNEPAVGGSALEVIVPSNLTPCCGQWHRLQDQAQNETRLWWIAGELRVS
jgi:hypothetical protein